MMRTEFHRPRHRQTSSMRSMFTRTLSPLAGSRRHLAVDRSRMFLGFPHFVQAILASLGRALQEPSLDLVARCRSAGHDGPISHRRVGTVDAGGLEDLRMVVVGTMHRRARPMSTRHIREFDYISSTEHPWEVIETLQFSPREEVEYWSYDGTELGPCHESDCRACDQIRLYRGPLLSIYRRCAG